MRTILFVLLLIFSSSITAQEVIWLSWDEAYQLSQTDKNPKKIFVDVYTDWCGWCKKMDKDTFQNPEVATYMQANYYMVKLNAEGKKDITYNGKTFKFVPQGRRGYHEFAAALLQGKMSYPTVVFLDENLGMLSPVPGYQKVEPFMQIARYFGENIYKEKDWKTYAGIGK
ncbi:thioredoxin fold domain-containing protein [Croceitalea sp. MTPC9]|uniref:thioredoxin family protein n=1 Tax=unclassified Croceitalea TaxID=2632280 RepID=UPI002B36C4EC|nr:thioredoxin fold domain-containing protein [Croceitalea sp. MTPC6]GMN15130.1 thioredoxin fold domain-containing protein [Croceitalea sp. MTPC9]